MKKIFSFFLVISIFLSIIFINSGVFAQEISVYIDGRKVFFDVPPAKIEGRTMVPLRAIFQGLGAFVEYDSKTRTITATKSNIRVQLTLDSTEAIVNGQLRVLDVPAMSLSGRTLVPLRFVGEAFGAEVKWEGSTQSIFIETADSPQEVEYPTPPPTEVPSVQKPVIYTVTHNVNTEIGPGYLIEVTLIGTSGGEAEFDISPLVTSVPMFEERTGVYTGSYTVKKNDFVKEAPITGRLILGGVKASPVQSGALISIYSGDTQEDKLQVYSITHNGTSPLTSGDVITVTLVGTDNGRAFFDLGTIAIDTPMKEIRPGIYEGSYTIKNSDKGSNLSVTGKLLKDGNKASLIEASQKVTIGDAVPEDIVIYSITHNGSQKLEAGNILEVILVGTPEGKAFFNIGEELKGIIMEEIQPGVYKGNYTVKNTDNITDAIISGYLIKDGLFSQEAQASTTVSMGTSQPVAGDEIKIYSFTHDGKALLKEGNELKVILVGPPGGVASFDITNFKSGLSMEEIQPGVYQGIYKVSRGDTVTEAVVLGHFSKDGKIAPIFEAVDSVTISGISPEISEIYPPDGSVIKTDRPNIYVTFDTRKGSLINPETVKLIVDGLDVSSELVKAPTFITFSPSSPLPLRRNIWIELSASDDNGNSVFHKWRFIIVPGIRSLITSASHNGQLPLTIGEKLEVTMFAFPGATGWFEIEGSQPYIPMVEVEEGKYVGEYPVTVSDNVTGAKLIVHLKTNLQENTLEVEPPITFDTEQGFSAPSIEGLADGQTVAFPLELKGYTKPFAKVEIKYEYKYALFGSPVILEGIAGTSRLSADEKGYFSDKYYSSWGSGTNHKITVTATDVSGEVSPSTVISVVEQ